MRLRLARHPNRLTATHPIIIDEFLELEDAGKQEAVATMISMLQDLHRRGRDCRYLHRLTGSPLWELKPVSRGGEKGGARVYLFLTLTGEAGVINCEVKSGIAANPARLASGLDVVVAYKNGIPVLEGVDRE
jgi:hypothetical protein